MSSKRTQSGRVMAGFVGAAVSFALTLALLVSMNQPVAKKQDKPRKAGVAMSVKPPPPPKRKPRKKRRKRRAKRTARKAPAAAPRMKTALNGLQVDLGQGQHLDLGGQGQDLVGATRNNRNLVMTEDSVDQPHKAVQRIAPSYPARARADGLTGKVTLSLLIDAVGNVKRVKVLSSTPPGVFDEAAIRAVEQWRFQPASYRGQQVRVWARQSVQFKLI